MAEKNTLQKVHFRKLKTLIQAKDTAFWSHYTQAFYDCTNLSDLIFLSKLATKAEQHGLAPKDALRTRILLLGAITFTPLSDAFKACMKAVGVSPEITIGDFDNYVSEILSNSFNTPFDIILIFPSRDRALYEGHLLDSSDTIAENIETKAKEILSLCATANKNTNAEIVLANFLPNQSSDIGAIACKTLGAESTYLKQLNFRLGMLSPPNVTLLDCENIASRIGLRNAVDPNAWIQSRQPGSPNYLYELAREFQHIVKSLNESHKKVLVLDLDNTLWGGIIGDDGLEGIVLGDTSPVGEAFRLFQKSILKLKDRGILLAVCSKNELDTAKLPFMEHPEMILKLGDFVSFKANWNPKSDNINDIATELNLGLDSFVFIDDNPAEIEIVLQNLPEVAVILLNPDPSQMVRDLEDSRYFEPRSLTMEDKERTGQYQQESKRKQLHKTVTNMEDYIKSLEMEAESRLFRPIDIPRISQLINKSNQFNLTSLRRSISEVEAITQSRDYVGWSIRLRDRFGDHGIISVIICKLLEDALEIDSWLMSCRVLQRNVENLALNQIVDLAKTLNFNKIIGKYIKTAKNNLVVNHYDKLNFLPVSDANERLNEKEYHLRVEDFQASNVQINITESPLWK